MTTRWHARAQSWQPLLIVLVLLLGGCASVPRIHLTRATQPGEVHFRGVRGVLGPRQEAAILQRLKVESPDADVLQRHLALEEAIVGAPLTADNGVTILRDGVQTFPAMFKAIREARQSLLLEYYIFEDVESEGERLSDLLLARRAAGVDIAIIYDSVGSLRTPDAFFATLRAAGIQLLAYNPINPLRSRGHWSLNDRDHRKILVADHRLGIVGGINLSVTYQSKRYRLPGSRRDQGEPPRWRDTDVQIVGPAVAELERLFRAQWANQDGPPLVASPAARDIEAGGDEVVHIIGSSPGAPTPRYYATVLSAIDTAEVRVWITAGYFVPTHQQKEALIRAARRGVDVRLLLPSKSDSSAALAIQFGTYGDLLAAGVRIYERDDVIVHSKSILVDGVWSVVGSSNFDSRSVLYNDEVDAVIVGRDAAAHLERLFLADGERAQQVELDTWKHRPLRDRLRELFWRAWSSLL